MSLEQRREGILDDARPNAIDDHRALMPADLKIPVLPKREPKALGAASGARFLMMNQLKPETTSGPLETISSPLATQHELLHWNAKKGEKLKFHFNVDKAAKTAIHLVASHQPGGAVLTALIDGKPILLEGKKKLINLKTDFSQRILNIHFEPVELNIGTHSLELECIENGPAGFDYLWTKP